MYSIMFSLALLVITSLLLSKVWHFPKNIILLYITQPLVMAAMPVIVFIGGLISSQLAADESLATLPITLMIVGVAFASLPASLLAKKKGRKIATQAGFTIALFASLIAVLALNIHSFILFSIANLAFGISAAFVQQMRFAAMESTADKNKIPQTLSILMLSGIFAAFLGPEVALFGQDLVAENFTGSFLLLAILNIIAMLLFIRFKDPIIKIQEATGTTRPLADIIKQPIFIISISCAAIGYALMSYLMTATPLSMHHIHGHSLEETKWVIQSHIAAMFLPSLVTGWLVKKVALKGLCLFGTVIYALVALIALSGEQFMHYWWALVLLGIGWNFLFLTGTSLLPESYQQSERHKVQATNDVILFTFQAAASLLAGWVLFNGGWNMVVFSSIPFIAMLFIVSWYYYHIAKR